MFKRGKGLLKNNKGQSAVEYIIVAAGLFTALISFYIVYSHLVPKQFDKGAQVILKEYEAGK